MSRRQSSRFNSVAPEQQITQFLVENPLVSSILDDDVDRVDQIASARTRDDVLKHDQERQTPLHYAAFIGNPVRKNFYFIKQREFSTVRSFRLITVKIIDEFRFVQTISNKYSFRRLKIRVETAHI